MSNTMIEEWTKNSRNKKIETAESKVNLFESQKFKCETIKYDELGLQTKLLKDVINEFDTKYKTSNEELQKIKMRLNSLNIANFKSLIQNISLKI